jgi:hypothetical protein
VAAAPEQLAGVVVAERLDRGGIGEPDHAVGIHDPDRLRGGLQHRGEELLRVDLQARQISQRTRHRSPRT